MRIIPTSVHGILDYVVSLLLIAAPWLLGFAGHNAATYVPVTLGSISIVYSLFTDYEWGPIKALSMPTHLVLDFASGFILAVSPWLFGFNKYVFIPHLVVGILEILISLMTDPFPYGIGKDLEARKNARSADHPIKPMTDKI